MSKLDMTETKLTGINLEKEILNRAKSTQTLVVQTLPDTLTVTQDQYDSLSTSKLTGLGKVYVNKESIFAGGGVFNTMEIEIK